MKIGIIKEIKNLEGRVAMTPDGVKAILASNPEAHEIFVQAHAGELSGYTDEEFIAAGAKILPTAADVFENAIMIVHVKEPLPPEFPLIKEHHILFTYLHLAVDAELTKELMKLGCVGIAYETLEDENGRLPLLAPMSKVAGRMAFVYGIYTQQKKVGGQGIYAGTIDGKNQARCLIIGGGVVGVNSAESFLGIGTDVVILERNPTRREELKSLYPKATILADTELNNELPKADIVVGAVLIPGAKAPRLITKEHLKTMKKGAVIVDISIDQGGITEVSRPTSIENPSYEVDGVIINCIPNIPGTVPRTSAHLLAEATLPYVIKLANQGLEVLKTDNAFKTALNIYKGKCTNKSVCEATGVAYTNVETL